MNLKASLIGSCIEDPVPAPNDVVVKFTRRMCCRLGPRGGRDHPAAQPPAAPTLDVPAAVPVPNSNALVGQEGGDEEEGVDVRWEMLFSPFRIYN